MGEEQLFAKARPALRRDDLGGEAGEVRVVRAVLRLPGERNQCGAARLDGETELRGDAICEIRRAHLWNGEAAGGDDECGRAVVRRRSVDDETFAVAHLGDVLVEDDADAGGAALRFEHGDDVARGAIAEELAEGLLVIGDAVFLDQRDEVAGRVAGERGLREVRVGGEEVLGCAVEVGEVAAAAAGDEDLFADAIGMIEKEDAAAALACLDGSHKPCRACAEYEKIAGLFVKGGGAMTGGMHEHAGLCRL